MINEKYHCFLLAVAGSSAFVFHTQQLGVVGRLEEV